MRKNGNSQGTLSPTEKKQSIVQQRNEAQLVESSTFLFTSVWFFFFWCCFRFGRRASSGSVRTLIKGDKELKKTGPADF